MSLRIMKIVYTLQNNLFLRKPIKKTVIVYPLGHYKSIEKLEKDMVNVVGADLFDFKKTKEIDLSFLMMQIA